MTEFKIGDRVRPLGSSDTGTITGYRVRWDNGAGLYGTYNPDEIEPAPLEIVRDAWYEISGWSAPAHVVYTCGSDVVTFHPTTAEVNHWYRTEFLRKAVRRLNDDEMVGQAAGAIGLRTRDDEVPE